MLNQNPEQLARDEIDRSLLASGWVVQSKNKFNLAAVLGVAIRELHTSVGLADYVLFVAQKPVGIIEAKRDKTGMQPTIVDQSLAIHAKTKAAPIASVFNITRRVGASCIISKTISQTY